MTQSAAICVFPVPDGPEIITPWAWSINRQVDSSRSCVGFKPVDGLTSKSADYRTEPRSVGARLYADLATRVLWPAAWTGNRRNSGSFAQPGPVSAACHPEENMVLVFVIAVIVFRQVTYRLHPLPKKCSGVVDIYIQRLCMCR